MWGVQYHQQIFEERLQTCRNEAKPPFAALVQQLHEDNDFPLQ
jgi:hypothetical protein